MRRESLCTACFAIFCSVGSTLVFAEDLSALTSKDGRIQIRVPDGYSEKPPAAPAKIEATDDATNAAILVIAEQRQHCVSLQAYGNRVRSKMLAKLTDAQSDAGEEIKIGESPAIRYEMTGIAASGKRMAFLLTVVETKTYDVQVLGGIQRSEFADHRAEFIAASNSLKELAPKQQ